MKTVQEIHRKEYLADMRSSALRARAMMHPDSQFMGLAKTSKHAASAIRNAIVFRDLARGAK